MKKALFLPLLLLLLLGFCLADDSLYPTTIGKLSAQARMYGSGTVSGLAQGEYATFQTLTFQESDLQKVSILKEALYINGETIYPKHILDEFNNKYVVFTIPQNGDFNYELIADINTTSIIPQMSDYNITSPPESVKVYAQPSEKIESGSTEILTLAKNKLYGNDFLDTLNKTILWVNDYVVYATGSDFSKYYLEQRSAVDTLIDKKGVCSEFANLGASLLRAKGIPTRIATGITYDGKDWGNHAWIEVYHEKLNTWVPSDPTFRESGFVDATHIRTGSYSDITLSLAKATYPQTAKVSFYTQTLPEVKVLGKEFFDEVALSTQTTELKSSQWNTIKLEVQNLTNMPLNVPVSIRENYKELIIQQKKQSIFLGPMESGEISFDIYPNLDLNAGQVAKGTITFNSLSAPQTQDFTISPSQEKDGGVVSIDDITPIAHENRLSIQITATNYFPEEKSIDINIQSKHFSLNGSEDLPGFSNKVITKEIPDINDDYYTVTVNTPTNIYTQTIVPQKQAVEVAPTKTVTPTGVNEGIPSNDEHTITESLTENPLTIIIVLLAGVAIMLFWVFWAGKKYV